MVENKLVKATSMHCQAQIENSIEQVQAEIKNLNLVANKYSALFNIREWVKYFRG